MKLSLNWIKDYVNPSLEPKELAEKITSSLTEVAKVEKIGSDTVLEIENKALAHRADCFCQKGLAREVAAITKSGFTDKHWADIPSPTIEKPFTLEVNDSKLCPRYTAIVIDNLSLKTSPKWMQERLLAAGMRPINTIVDVTNYVMLGIGQPLHAFDYDQLTDHKIIVRAAAEGETLTTLDGSPRQLPAGATVITDPRQILAVAGIMGGAGSEIGPGTKTIVIESANFEMYAIRRASARLGLRTEASTRFEKGLDPNLTEEGLKMAVELILQLIPEAKVASKIFDVYPQRVNGLTLEIEFTKICQTIGQKIESPKIMDILNNLGLKTWIKGNVCLVEIPTYRRDLTIAADIGEEVARIYGLENLKTSLPTRDLTPTPTNDQVVFEREIKKALASLGLNEIYTYSFVSRETLADSGFEPNHCYRLINPLSPKLEYFRPSLVPNLLEIAKLNLKYGNHLAIFELGRTATKVSEGLPEEPRTLAGVIVGEKEDFFTTKGLLEALLEKIALRPVDWEMEKEVGQIYLPGATAKIMSGEKWLGKMGQLSPKLSDTYNLPATTYVFEFDLAALKEKSGQISYQPPSKHPASVEDLSVIVEQSLPTAKIIETIEKNATAELQITAAVKEVYAHQKLGADKKSVTVKINYQSPSHTLTEKELSSSRRNIIEALANKLKGLVRQSPNFPTNQH
ncbi:MAG: phenylalanine--tRNA ligase subunit beta [bacterium]|nr:phenylalanine--tRNA ligase subunit beta [bacterium]